MRTPLVGRAHELRQVEQGLRRIGTVTVHGVEGVGRTRLAQEVIERAAARGHATILSVATRGSAAIPFAAVSGLLPPGQASGELGATIRAGRAWIEARATDEPVLIVVDDVQWLDVGSRTLLHQLAALDGVRLLLTVRADEPVHDEITSLWKDGLAVRVDLEALGRAGNDRLLAALLGGPVHPTTSGRLWELSRGNPLFLRELVDAAAMQGRLAEEEGTWRLTDQPSVTPRLIDLVAARMGGLDAPARLGVVALTLIERLGYASFTRLVGVPTVAQLEASETVEVVVVGRRRVVRLGHPVYGEVIRSTTPHTELVQVADRLLDALPELAGARWTDRGELADLWLLAGRTGRPDLFEAAARTALGVADHARAAELAAAAVDRGGGFGALVTLGEALVYLGRSPVAEDVLARAWAEAGDDQQRVRVALLRSHDRLFNAGDPVGAETVLVDAGRTIDDPGCRDRLAAARALAAAMRGDLPMALAASERVLDRAEADDQVLLGTLTVTTVAHALVGDVRAAMRDVRRARPLIAPQRDALPLAGDQIGIVEVVATWHDGRIREAVELAEAGHARAAETGGPEQVGPWLVARATVLAARGRLGEAHDLAADAASRLEESDALGLRGTALSLQARCAAGLGDRAGAAAALAVARLHAARDLRTRIHASRAEVWLSASEGRIERACAEAVEHGRRAIADSYKVWGACILHDAVRFGAAVLVRDELAALADEHDAGLLRLLADHAAGLDDGDADALCAVASRFEAGGADLLAAETMMQAADILQRGGRPREATSCEAAASQLSSRCGDVVAPALIRAEDPLTGREREIALMAHRGLTSRAIADELVLSSRTVDNHLASIYRKTGIAGRHELDVIVGGDPTASRATGPG